MRVLNWILRIVLFIVLFGFAVMNSATVPVRFFFGTASQVPLVLVMLAFFVGGIVVGLGAVLATLMRQRKEIAMLRDAHPVRREEDGTL